MLDENYWTDRYRKDNTGWDLATVSPPLKAYIDQLVNKEIRILIPGAGKAYEASYLWENGFKNVFVLDLSKAPLDALLARNPDFPKEQLLHADFFPLQMQFDLILEQTFFCALDPKLRSAYSKKCHELLKPNGKLVGLLFNRDFEAGPPFGGDIQEYKLLFEALFQIDIMQDCYNSIPPRQGSELFIKLIKTKNPR